MIFQWPRQMWRISWPLPGRYRAGPRHGRPRNAGDACMQQIRHRAGLRVARARTEQVRCRTAPMGVGAGHHGLALHMSACRARSASNRPGLRTVGLDIAGDFQIEPRHAGHAALTGKQLHPADPQITQDLCTDAVAAQRARIIGRTGPALCRTVSRPLLDLVEHGFGIGRTVEHQQHAIAMGPDGLQGRRDGPGMAARRPQQIQRRQGFVHPHAGLLLRRRLAHHQGQMWLPTARSR